MDRYVVSRETSPRGWLVWDRTEARRASLVYAQKSEAQTVCDNLNCPEPSQPTSDDYEDAANRFEEALYGEARGS